MSVVSVAVAAILMTLCSTAGSKVLEGLTTTDAMSAVVPSKTKNIVALSDASNKGIVPLYNLPTVVQNAVAHDPTVLATLAQEAAAQSRLAIARSRWYPTAALSTNKGKSYDLESNTVVHREVGQANAELRWNLYNGGNDNNEINATEKELIAAKEDVRKAREDISERVSEAYFDVVRQDALLQLVTSHLAEVRKLDERVAEQLRQGKASDADRLQAASSLLTAESALNDVRSTRRSAQARMAALVGWEQGVDVELEPYVVPSLQALTARGPMAEIDVADDASMVSSSPGVASALARAAALRARVNPLLAALAPRFDMSVKRQLSNTTSPNYSSIPQKSWSLNVAWEYPLGGETLHRRDESSSRALAAEEDAERAAMTVRADLFSLPARIYGSRDLLPRLEVQVKLAHRLADAATAQYEAGRRTVQQLVQTHEVKYDLSQRWLSEVHKLNMAWMHRLTLRGEWLSSLATSELTRVPAEPPVVLSEPSTALSKPQQALPSVPSGSEVTPVPDSAMSAAKPADIPAATPEGAPAASVPSEVAQSMADWLKAWSEKNVDDYLSSYSPDFKPETLSPAAWRAQRRARLRNAGDLQVTVSQAQWQQIDDQTMEVVFVQDYRAAKYGDTTNKRLRWQNVNGRWLIVREQVVQK